MSIKDDENSRWRIRYDSQDDLNDFARELLLLNAVNSKEEVVSTNLVIGEGRGAELGDSLEVQMVVWEVRGKNPPGKPLFLVVGGRNLLVRPFSLLTRKRAFKIQDPRVLSLLLLHHRVSMTQMATQKLHSVMKSRSVQIESAQSLRIRIRSRKQP